MSDPAPLPAPAPAPAAADFASMLPEDIRGDVSFKDIKDVGGLARSYLGQGKLLGVPKEQLVQLPLATDPAEAWNPVYDRLGRPETPDKYALTDPKEIPVGLTLNPATKTAFMTEMHGLGISQKQADAIWQSRNTGMIGQFNAAIAEVKEGLVRVETTLKTEWGAEYDAKTAAGNAAIAHFATQFKLGDTLQNAVDATPGDSGIAVRKLFAELGRQMQADKIIGSGGGGIAGSTPAEALAERSRLFADTEFMKQYRNPNRTIRQPAIDRMMALNETIAAATTRTAA